MEYQKRGVASAPKRIPPLKGRASQERRLTVMIMGSVGKIYSFKISPALLLAASLFCLIFVFASILVINDYLTIDEGFGFHRVAGVQAEKIRVLEREVSRKEEQMEKAGRNVSFLEDYIKNLEGQKKEIDTAGAETPKADEPAVKAEERPKQAERRAEPPRVVDVKDVLIQKQGSQITVGFKLMNLLPPENAVGGYIHVIARDSKSDPPKEWSYPKQNTLHGKPVNYRRGLMFLIQRFKPITGTINLASGTEIPSYIIVLAYDQAGEIILEKEFEVSNAS